MPKCCPECGEPTFPPQPWVPETAPALSLPGSNPTWRQSREAVPERLEGLEELEQPCCKSSSGSVSAGLEIPCANAAGRARPEVLHKNDRRILSDRKTSVIETVIEELV